MEINIEAKNPSKIKVFGVGGGGSNAVARMYQEGLQDVELYIVNTDLQHLASLPVPNKIHIGESKTRGLGAGSKPEVGREAALENLDKIKEAMEGADMIFIAAGLGGGTGTGAAPVIAQAAKEMGILTVAVVTKPFAFEGKIRANIAEQGLQEIKDKVDTYIVIHNEKLLSIAGRNLAFSQAFKLVDNILYRAVRGITDLILVPALINLDFADVKTIMENAGKALIGVGSGKGENKIEEAVISATTSPLLEGTSIQGAKRILINIEVSPDLSFIEVNEAIKQIREQAHEEAHIIFGAAINNEIEDEIKITVVATDFEGEEKEDYIQRKKEISVQPTQQRKVIIPPKTEKEQPKEIPKVQLNDDFLNEDLDIPAYIRKRGKPS
ncbi:cell division protein FtsZ [Venenivibrio stagnispumantis]|uniref:Cell division protein FtsZ n=1 Tax=Venenivibrio stagnispumantis TaxID=407998 RepID=A0AA45WM17_9AQUI|nr:cell division protein FtsZ [Venenivibrio stagnispumantis]MCW4572890.1 cell division protein FtsZ [Venenivibrio stagnispumantis]SMP12842.1 cell division protein FtsZ [Venenivibrio stagnispumantis]